MYLLGVLAASTALAPLSALSSPAEPRTRNATRQAAGDLAELQAAFDRARSVFNSAAQPDSIQLLAEIIDSLEVATTTATSGVDSDGAGVTALLAQALSLRAQAQLNIGEDADADLRRLIVLSPDARLDPSLVSPKLVELLDNARFELIGMLRVTRDPPDAVVFVDGVERELIGDGLSLTAGSHQVAVERLGYTSVRNEIEIIAGEVVDVDGLLERVSAVVTILTAQPGASVAVDGVDKGLTASSDGDGSPAMLVFDGVVPGQHTITITRADYRPVEDSVAVDDLTNYSIGPVSLEPTAGMLVLRGFPTGARLLVDDIETASTRSDAGSHVVDLPPGDHAVVVDGGALGSFAQQLTLADLQQVEITVALRPTVGFLGVLGDDTVGAERLVEALESATTGGAWLMRPQQGGSELLGSPNDLFDVDLLRDLARTGVQHRLDARRPRQAAGVNAHRICSPCFPTISWPHTPISGSSSIGFESPSKRTTSPRDSRSGSAQPTTFCGHPWPQS